MNKLLLLLITFFPVAAQGVKCPIPNCPKGQLCFCPPPPPHYMVIKDKSTGSNSKAGKIFTDRLKSNFALTASFSFKNKFSPKYQSSKTPLDQISKWHLITLKLKQGNKTTGVEVKLFSRKTPRSSRKKEIWETSFNFNSSNLKKSTDLLGNQLMAKIIQRKFSAFGSKMAYVHNITRGKSYIRVAHFNGEEKDQSLSSHKLVSFKVSYNKEPFWGPRGEYLFFTSHARYNPDLYIVKPGNNPVKPLRISARNGMNHAAVLSNKRKYLALTMDFRGNPDIYLLKPDFKTTKKWRIIKKLTTHHSIDTSPSFSPDGKRIVFVSNRRKRAQIFTKKIKGGKPRLLFSTGNRTYTPRWCSSGKREYLAFTQLVGNKSVIYVYDLKTRGGWQATSSSAPNAENPAWSPHCNLISYESSGSKTKKNGIWISPVRGGKSSVFLKGSLTMPAWDRGRK
ncbi:MAG: hypothetical protein PF689_13245 [Deltaproteobacteria bacterium]|jgi:tol-pal system beta propeller repeat protein TolB|nr:hypothetical protein [Deltaproteobacteria bacterium]